ncbi:glycosyltransferase family 2 protein [Acetobacter oeni]|nr:glycosyltransferase family 2 protein [Acetobacter oeni]MBB3883017.1 GT2 family glycosyltransferase [Acetobacter oeni]NHO19093.1 glycosyltransferase [Acetobacter oeni]
MSSDSSLRLHGERMRIAGPRDDVKVFGDVYPESASPGDNQAYALWARGYDAFSDIERELTQPALPTDRAAWPKIALLIETSDVRPDLLEDTIRSVMAQSYNGWTIYTGADAATPPHIVKSLRTYAETHEQISLSLTHGSIQETLFSDSHEAYVAFLNAGDQLAKDALLRVARMLVDAPDTALVYTDEDALDAGGLRRDSRLKPGWSDDQLLAGDTVGQLAVFCRKRINELGGFATATACARESGLLAAEDIHYALKLSVAEGLLSNRIQHLPDILFHRRYGAGLTPACLPSSSGYRIASRHLAFWRPDICLMEGTITARLPESAGEEHAAAVWPRVLYPLPAQCPTVSVVIPTRDNPDLLRTCMTGLLGNTNYPALNVVIIDNGSCNPETLHLFRELETDSRVTVPSSGSPFNWSRLNNEAVRDLTSDLVLLLNDDVEILHPDWLDEMVRQIMRPDVGVVGAKLLYADGTLQHGGVVLSEDGATHILRGSSPGDPGYLGQLAWQRDLLAVTGACLLIRREVYNCVGGLDEEFRVTCNDIDLCLRAGAAGWRVVWTPHAVLTHLDGATRGRDVSIAKLWLQCSETARLAGRWDKVMAHDSSLNPSLRATDHHLLLAWPPPCRPL